MKKLGILILSAILLSNISAYRAYAESVYYTGDYTINYNISENDTITITKCTGNGENLYIPDTIDGLPITEIDSSAFVSCTNLKTITVSDDNQYFVSENNMLMNRNKINLIKYTGSDQTAVIPYGIEKIESHAFFGSEPEYINIPETVSYIDDYAFMGCTALKEIYIPSRVEYIGKSCFFSCPYLSAVNIPEGITAIYDDTFYACPSLLELVIPQSVTTIGNDILSPAESNTYNPVIYGFYGSPAKSYAQNNSISYKMIGDANEDLLLDSSDASSILCDYASVSAGNSSSFSHIQSICGDMNRDGNINSADASAVLLKYAEISSGG